MRQRHRFTWWSHWRPRPGDTADPGRDIDMERRIIEWQRQELRATHGFVEPYTGADYRHGDDR